MKTRLTISIDESTANRLKDIGKNEGRTISSIIEGRLIDLPERNTTINRDTNKLTYVNLDIALRNRIKLAAKHYGVTSIYLIRIALRKFLNTLQGKDVNEGRKLLDIV